MPDLDDRRRMLRAALAAEDPHDTAGFAAALDGADEEERAALARTLPASRLLAAEGLTPRAAFVLAALGKPRAVATALLPWPMGKTKDLSERYREAWRGSGASFVRAARDRDAHWASALIVEALGRSWSSRDIVFSFGSALVRTWPEAISKEYLNLFTAWCTPSPDPDSTPAERGRAIAGTLLNRPELLDLEFWALFRVEGGGAAYSLTGRTEEDWLIALGIIQDRVPGFRARLLDESLGALLRDFSAANVAWYRRLFPALNPTDAESLGRSGTLAAILGVAPSPVVGMAQEQLLRVAERIDPADVIAASPAVLLRTEKKLLKAQLALLARITAAHPERAEAIAGLVDDARETLPPDLASTAGKLLGARAKPMPAVAGEPVFVPPPHRVPLPGAVAPPPRIEDAAGLRALLAVHLEGAGDGAELPAILAFLGHHPESSADDALLERAEDVRASVWDVFDASPRRKIAAVLLARAGRPVAGPGFRGYPRYVSVREGEPDPQGAELSDHTSTTSHYDRELGEWVEEAPRTFRSGYRYIPTIGPLAQFVAQFHGPVRVLPLARRDLSWERRKETPGEGIYSGYRPIVGVGELPFWAATDPDTSSADAFERGFFDLDAVAAEFSFRVQEAREQDGYAQIVQWACWILAQNPGVLVAHFQPMLLTATKVVNVRGVAELLQALGAARVVPDAPVYSALALGLSAKEPAHRAQAAEALAQLAACGLFDPASFAAQLAADLDDGFALSARVAAALADAASISALAGYRVLQALGALLPFLPELHQPGKLVELAARLSDEYGTPLVIPAVLAAKRKGSSVLAVGIRALEGVVPRPTPLAAEAAEQAGGGAVAGADIGAAVPEVPGDPVQGEGSGR